MASSSISRTDSTPPERSPARPSELLNFISNDFLHEIVYGTVQNTGATGAAIALGHPEEMVCRATAGECPSEIAKINLASGLTGLSASGGMIQYCMNTDLDARVDADACRELGIAAIMVAPLFWQGQLLGLVEVFSQRPYAFGMRDLQALEALSEGFCAKLRLNVQSRTSLSGGRSQRQRFSLVQKISLYAVGVVLCFLIGLRWGWKFTDPKTNLAGGKVILISTVPALSPEVSLSHLAEGALLNRLDPTYPEDALRQHIQGQVVLQIRIGKDGFVYDAKVIRGESTLSRAALDAVREWRFTPHGMNKKPLEVAQITFDFSLVK